MEEKLIEIYYSLFLFISFLIVIIINLLEQILEEVPRVVVEYYLHNKIYPSDPVLNI